MERNYEDVLKRYSDPEVFRWIPGFEGCYEVSNYGRVKSHKGRSPYIIIPKITQAGYWYVHLSTGAEKPMPRTKSIGISRLVAAAFLSNPKNLPEVDHINNQKWDNHLSNLQWIEHDYNCRKDQAYLYKCWNVSNPSEIIWLESKREVERRLNKSYGWLAYRLTMVGKPSRDGWIVEVQKLKGSEKKRW